MEPGINPNRRKITGPVFDVDEERRLATNEFLDLGYPLDDATRYAGEIMSRLGYLSANGEPVWKLRSGDEISKSGLAAGRRAAVLEIHEAVSLLKHGPDPAATIREALLEYGQSDEAITAKIVRSGIARTPTGGIRFRGRVGGDEMLRMAISTINKELETERRATTTDPLFDAEVRSRGYGI